MFLPPRGDPSPTGGVRRTSRMTNSDGPAHSAEVATPEGSRAPWSFNACAEGKHVSTRGTWWMSVYVQSINPTEPAQDTHSLSRSRGTTRQWTPCRPCRSRRSWRRAGCTPRTCPGWWQPAQLGPGTGHYWCPAWKTSSLWSPYSWPPGSCPALQTQRQTDRQTFLIRGQLYKWKMKPCQCAQKYLSCFQYKSTRLFYCYLFQWKTSFP